MSITLECLQAYVPGRTTSSLDTLLNIIGTLLGVTLGAILSEYLWNADWKSRTLDRIFHPDPLTKFGLVILSIWVLSQTAPFVPSLDVGNIKNGIKPAWRTFSDLNTFSFQKLASYFTQILGLTLLADSLLIQSNKTKKTFYLTTFFSMVLLLKIPILKRQISLESLFGLIIGLLIYLYIENKYRKMIWIVAISSIIVYIMLAGTQGYSGTDVKSSSMHWIPFSTHLTNTVIGITDILQALWPVLVLGYFTIGLEMNRSLTVFMVGSILLVSLFLSLELLQQYIPGRTPDITDVLLAICAWIVPWTVPGLRKKTKELCGK